VRVGVFVELFVRCSFVWARVGIRTDGSETLEHRDYLILFGEAIEEVKAEMKAKGREDEFIGAKVTSRLDYPPDQLTHRPGHLYDPPHHRQPRDRLVFGGLHEP
jgi:hypothetical protein